MAIIQGSNAPIIVTVGDDLSAIETLSVGLYKPDRTLIKQFTASEITTEGSTIKVNLTPAFTKTLSNIVVLSVKGATAAGDIIFYDEADIIVRPRMDKDVTL